MDKRIVFCTGDFDVVHIGHVRFLKKAGELGNYLVVCLNNDGIIRKKDESRPVFDVEKRKEFLLSLSYVDEVTVNEGNEAELLNKYMPHFYAVGNPDYVSRDILAEMKKINCDLKIVDTVQLSSDRILSSKFEKVDWSNLEYISRIKKIFSLKEFEGMLENIKRLRILVIGDAIIDEYYFTSPKGRAVKDPIMSVDYEYHEKYAGGALAISNHAACFCDNVKLVTLIGDTNTSERFIKKSLRANIELKTFTKDNSPTTVKRRFIDKHRNTKLFKLEYINDAAINSQLEGEICSYLENELGLYDIVLVGDFGHGFITEKIIRALEKSSRFLAVNVQTNSSNMGYNYFTKYTDVDYISMDEAEARLVLQSRFSDMKEMISQIKGRGYKRFLITAGKKGNIYVNKSVTKAPILISSVKDTVGAGDAVFSITSLLAHADYNEELLAFIANCVGGIAVNIMGNKEPVTKESLMEFIGRVVK